MRFAAAEKGLRELAEAFECLVSISRLRLRTWKEPRRTAFRRLAFAACSEFVRRSTRIMERLDVGLAPGPGRLIAVMRDGVRIHKAAEGFMALDWDGTVKRRTRRKRKRQPPALNT